jgi:glycosyltransferase involved in cell wall biosynthesis
MLPTQHYPLISVVIPAYQAAGIITPTLKSLLRQNYPHVETIVIDDGSNDGLAAVVQAIQQQFPKANLRYVWQENQGVSVARNHGFSLAKGEYVAFLDADDLWLPEKLTVDMETLQRYQNPVCMVYSGVYSVDDELLITNIPKHEQVNAEDFASVLNTFLQPSCTLLHRHIVESLGGFPHNSECYQEDRVFYLRVLKDFPAFATGQRQVLYRQVDAGRALKVLYNYDEAVEAEQATIRSFAGLLNEADFDTLDAFHTRSLMNRFLRFGHFQHALRYAKEVPTSLLVNDKKGHLTLLSLCCKANLLYAVQEALRFILKYALLPWWQFKRAPLLR